MFCFVLRCLFGVFDDDFFYAVAVGVWEGFYVKAHGFADEAEWYHGAVEAGYDVWGNVHGRLCFAVNGVVGAARGHDDGFVVIFDGDFVGFAVPVAFCVECFDNVAKRYKGAVLVSNWANVHGFGLAVDVDDVGAKGQGNGAFFRVRLVGKGKGVAEYAVFVAVVITKGEFDFTGAGFVAFNVAVHGAVGGEGGEAGCVKDELGVFVTGIQEAIA